MKTAALVALVTAVGLASTQPADAQSRGRATGTTSGTSTGRIGGSTGTAGRTATVRGSVSNVGRARADNTRSRGIGAGTGVVRNGSGYSDPSPRNGRAVATVRGSSGSIGGSTGRVRDGIGGGSGRASGIVTGGSGRSSGIMTGGSGRSTGIGTPGRASGVIGDGSRSRSGGYVVPAVGVGSGSRGSAWNDPWRRSGRNWRSGVSVIRDPYYYSPWGGPLLRSCYFSIGRHTGFGCVNLFPAATLFVPYVLFYPPILHVHTTSHKTSSHATSSTITSPAVVDAAMEVDDAACAVVTVLLPGNDGYWKTLRLPAAGAATRDQLRRYITERLDAGQPFRIADADGVTIDVPASAQVDRIVIDPCR